MCGNNLHPLGQPKWDWAFMVHGNRRYGHYKKWCSCRKSWSVNNFSAANFGRSMGSRPEKTNPTPGPDFTALTSWAIFTSTLAILVFILPTFATFQFSFARLKIFGSIIFCYYYGIEINFLFTRWWRTWWEKEPIVKRRRSGDEEHWHQCKERRWHVVLLSAVAKVAICFFSQLFYIMRSMANDSSCEKWLGETRLTITKQRRSCEIEFWYLYIKVKFMRYESV